MRASTRTACGLGGSTLAALALHLALSLAAVGLLALPRAAADEGEAADPAAGSSPPADPAADASEATDGSREVPFDVQLHGEYQHRVAMLGDVPVEALPRTDATTLGRNLWGEQWLRTHGELTLGDEVRLVGELDLLWGTAYGDLSQGVQPAFYPLDGYGYPGARLRQLYLDWRTPIGLLRVGQTAFSWGLGTISNGGSEPPLFGDYRFGDLVRRVLFATRPAGAESPFTLAVAFDWVGWDAVADFERRGDLALQGVLAGFYEQGDDRVGAYVAYRHQTNPLDDALEVFVGDAYARLYFPEPSGGRVLAALEAVYIRGTTTYARTLTHPSQELEQFLAVARLGRVHPELDVVLEGGFASGDSNPEDGFQRRGTMDPDHRVGLILFPEVLAAQTARSAYLASSPELFGRPARGAELLPTNGAVAGAYYLMPYAVWRPLAWLEARTAMLLAWASSDVVDPFGQRARSRATNYLGGDPAGRDLGLELDAALLARGPVAPGLTLSGGVEAGVLLPGSAFANAEGVVMPPVGMGRLRVGLVF